MKLTNSARYLSLLLDTFQSRIVPDLHSPDVTGNVGFFSDALKEVLRRELHYADVLPSINAEAISRRYGTPSSNWVWRRIS